MAALPCLSAAIAWTSDAFGSVWTDVTPWLLPRQGVTFSRGRQDQQSPVTATECGLTLDNTDGRFTPNRAASPYYPNVRSAAPLRVWARPAGVEGNMVDSATSLLPDGQVGAWRVPLVTPASQLSPHTPSATWEAGALKATWTATDWGAGAYVFVPTVIGRTYTARVDVQILGTSPHVSFHPNMWDYITPSTRTTSKGVWQTLTITWTAFESMSTLGLTPVTAATSSDSCLVRRLQVDQVEQFVQPFTSAPAPAPRWTGRMSDLAVGFSGPSSALPVTGVDVIAEHSRLRLDGWPTEAARWRGAVAGWPLTDPQGTRYAKEVIGRGAATLRVVRVGNGGGLQWQGATGPAADAASCLTFAPESGSGSILTTAIPWYLKAGDDRNLTLSLTVSTSSVVPATLAFVDCWLGRSVTLKMNAAGQIWAELDPGEVLATQTVPAGRINDGQTHVVTVQITPDSIGPSVGVRAHVWLDGTRLTDAGSAFMATQTPPVSVTLGGMWFGGELFTGALSNVTLYTSSIDPVDINADLAGGMAGLLPGEALGLLYDRVGVTNRRIALGKTRLAHIDTTGKSLVEVTDAITAADGGAAWADGWGTFVTSTRQDRLELTPTVLVDSHQISGGVVLSMDDAEIVNDLTVTSPALGSTRITNATSIARYGRRSATLEVLTSDPLVLRGAGLERLEAEPQLRLPTATIDILTSPADVAAALLAQEPGGALRITTMPTQAPTTVMDLMTEGWSEAISDSAWTQTRNLSPLDTRTFFTLDDNVLGLLDSPALLGY